MFEKKLQSALMMGLFVLSVSACGSQSNATDTVANARAAALTNQVDDDQDGHVDENDEGLDEDEDGRVDESGEHRDACEHRRHGDDDGESDKESSDADAGVDDDSDNEESHSHHRGRGDSDSDHDDAMSHDEKRAAEIAAIDCSDVPAMTDAGAIDDATQEEKAAEASL